MIRIVHISADYPDAFSASKTQAVRNLLDGTPALDHRVYSINRQNGLGGIQELDRSNGVTTLVYRAPKYGILLETYLNALADWIISDCKSRGEQIDLVHAHKLTIEGLAARRVADALGCPYICTVRGNTDRKYLQLKPEKRSAYREVAMNAAHLLPVTPWIERYLIRKLSLEDTRMTLLPTITSCDRFIPPLTARKRFVTAFHLDGWRLKGMPNLLSAIAALRADGTEIALDIVGGGGDAATKALEKQINARRLEDLVTLRGPVPHDMMQDALNDYAAFVLPTLRETFGMVYIEALFSGVPILYSQDRGVDGLFDDQDVGVRCDPKSVESIAEGLSALHAGADRMKANIRTLQETGGFERFRKKAVCDLYETVVTSVCETPKANTTAPA